MSEKNLKKKIFILDTMSGRRALAAVQRAAKKSGRAADEQV